MPIEASNDPPLSLIESANGEKINALSSSEFAPILNKFQHRHRWAPIVILCGLVVVAMTSSSGSPTLNYASLILLFLFGVISVAIDRYRRSVRIKYELQGVPATVAKTLAETFTELRNCRAIWSVTASGHTSDWKRNAGAQTLQKRKAISAIFSKPSCVRGSLDVPAFRMSTEQLYFFPDAILVVARNSVAALTYNDLSFSNKNIRFIEGESVPNDATIVDYTWRFVNKNGGPDRRFNFNKQIPICAYGEMAFSSAGGLNCVIQYSNSAAGVRFSEAIEILQRPQSHLEAKSFTVLAAPKNWPARVFAAMFVCAQAVLVVLVLATLQAGPPHSASSTLPPLSSTPVPIKPTLQMNPPNPPVQSVYRVPAERVPPQRENAVRGKPPQQPDASSSPLPLPISMRQCLSIRDVDERIECFEQVHSEGSPLER